MFPSSVVYELISECIDGVKEVMWIVLKLSMVIQTLLQTNNQYGMECPKIVVKWQKYCTTICFELKNVLINKYKNNHKYRIYKKNTVDNNTNVKTKLNFKKIDHKHQHKIGFQTRCIILKCCQEQCVLTLQTMLKFNFAIERSPPALLSVFRVVLFLLRSVQGFFTIFTFVCGCQKRIWILNKI